MTPDQILLVQTSFEMTGADGTALARSLAARIDTAPAPLARLLVLAVRGLTRRRVLEPALRRLAARDPATGGLALARPSAAAALVDALEEVLGTPLPRSASEAWQAWHRRTSALLAQAAARPARA
jgi:hypothetical protein